MTPRRSIGAALGVAIVVAAVAGCSAAQPSHGSASQPSATRTAAAPAAAARPTPQAAASAPPAPVAPAAPAACRANPAGAKHVYVSITAQHLWACTGSTLITESAVTTGASALTNVHDATPVGQYAIVSKSVHVTLAGSDVNGSWNDPVTYWMPFAGGDGFHDAPWQKFPLGSPLYTTQGSHGCVHVALPALTTLYNWADVGTPVTVTA